MNATKFQLDHDEQQHSNSIRRDKNQIMNGNRPSPLKISRGSYLIQKNGTNSSSHIAGSNRPPMREEDQQQQQRQPVIIYTQSPKVIHTQARDFMALVQKLTGLSPSDDTIDAHVNVDDSLSHDHIDNSDNKSVPNASNVVSVNPEDNDQSSVSSGLTDENCCGGGDNKNFAHQGISSNSGYSPNTMLSNPSPYYADIPLFTPNSNSSTDFFCSPRPLYRYSDSPASYAAAPGVGGGGSMSPSMFKFIKGLPEY